MKELRMENGSGVNVFLRMNSEDNCHEPRLLRQRVVMAGDKRR